MSHGGLAGSSDECHERMGAPETFLTCLAAPRLHLLVLEHEEIEMQVLADPIGELGVLAIAGIASSQYRPPGSVPSVGGSRMTCPISSDQIFLENGLFMPGL